MASCMNLFTCQSLWMATGWAFSHRIWLCGAWKGAGGCFTFLALAKRWQTLCFLLPSPGTSPEALDGFLGGGLKANSNWNLHKRRRHRCDQCSSSPCCSPGLRSQGRFSHCIKVHYSPELTVPWFQGLSWEIGSPSPEMQAAMGRTCHLNSFISPSDLQHRDLYSSRTCKIGTKWELSECLPLERR